MAAMKAACSERSFEHTDNCSKSHSFLQGLLAVSHKYQVSRLQLWCERQLSESINGNNVCTILCQAHLYEAKQLEQACLMFIKENKSAVMVTPMFGRLCREWPEVMLKISLFTAGISEARAAAAFDGQGDSSRGQS